MSDRELERPVRAGTSPLAATSARDLARVVERAEARAWTDAVRAATPEVTRRLGLATHRVAGGIALVTAAVPHILYNRAFGFGIDWPIDPATVDRAIALYRKDAPFSLQPCPATRPALVRDWLESRGLHSRYNWVRWVRDARPAPAAHTDLDVRAIGPAQARTFIDLAFHIFDEPAALAPWLALAIGRRGWTHYLTYDGRKAVGVAALYVEDDAGWLGWGGTLTSHRGRGGQSAALARRIHDARLQGCRWLTVETAEDLPERPNPSYRNCARAGFRVLYLRPSHAHFPTQSSR